MFDIFKYTGLVCERIAMGEPYGVWDNSCVMKVNHAHRYADSAINSQITESNDPFPLKKISLGKKNL